MSNFTPVEDGGAADVVAAVVPSLYDFGESDAVFMMICAFLLVTLQTGFVLLESACVAPKNEISMMIRNVVDIVLGGISFWLFGYAFMLGRTDSLLRNPFIALGDFLTDAPPGDPLMGPVLVIYLFQMTFSACCTTIVGGAVAERFNLKAYCLYSFLNTIVYCISAGWVWGEHGFLRDLGVVDIAGSGPVHLVGGASALAAVILVGPRLGRYDEGAEPPPLGNPVNLCLSLFILWWGWLGFNSGSVYGITGEKWTYAARAAVTTLLGSFGGGTFGVLYSMFRNKGKLDIVDLINGILGSMVSVTAGCALYHAWEAILIGAIGAALCVLSVPMIDKLRLDDPVGAVAVHGVAGIWSLLAVGLFANDPIPLELTNGRTGLFKGGGWHLLGVQSLMIVCLTAWGIVATFVLLWTINKVFPIRMTPDDELTGSDIVEHNLYRTLLPPFNGSAKPETNNSTEAVQPNGQKPNQWQAQMERMSPQNLAVRGADGRDSFKLRNIKSKNGSPLRGYDNQVFVMTGTNGGSGGTPNSDKSLA